MVRTRAFHATLAAVVLGLLGTTVAVGAAADAERATDRACDPARASHTTALALHDAAAERMTDSVAAATKAGYDASPDVTGAQPAGDCDSREDAAAVEAAAEQMSAAAAEMSADAEALDAAVTAFVAASDAHKAEAAKATASLKAAEKALADSKGRVAAGGNESRAALGEAVKAAKSALAVRPTTTEGFNAATKTLAAQPKALDAARAKVAKAVKAKAKADRKAAAERAAAQKAAAERAAAQRATQQAWTQPQTNTYTAPKTRTYTAPKTNTYTAPKSTYTPPRISTPTDNLWHKGGGVRPGKPGISCIIGEGGKLIGAGCDKCKISDGKLVC